jgi:hypothetical protein
MRSTLWRGKRTNQRFVVGRNNPAQGRFAQEKISCFLWQNRQQLARELIDRPLCLDLSGRLELMPGQGQLLGHLYVRYRLKLE